MNNDFKEFEWEDEVTQESSFTLLEEGDYRFRMVSMERGRHNGSDRIPPCNKAILDLTFKAPDGSRGKCKDFLLLHESVEWKLCAFFRSIGQKQHGTGITMDWSKVQGAKGRAHVIINDDGYNRVDKYLDPEEDEGALPWGN